jgi:hypothetical protein
MTPTEAEAPGEQGQEGAPLNEPFSQPEYETAFFKFLRARTRSLANSIDPIYSQINTRSPRFFYRGRNTIGQRSAEDPGDGTSAEETLDAEPIAAQSLVEFSRIAVIESDPEDLAGSIYELAYRHLESLMPQVYAALGRSADAVGNTVAGGGRPLSARLYLDVLRTIDIDFTDEGEARMPQMVRGQIGQGPIDKPDMTDAELAEEEEIIDAKRQQFLAQRRSRQLPRHPLRD